MNRITLVAAGLLALCAATARAQSEEELRAKELQERIKKEMAEIDELLLKADKSSPADAKAKIESVKKTIDELLKDVQGKQSSVCQNIDELVKLARYKKNGKGGQGGDAEGDGQGGQPQNQQRDKDRDPKELQKQGQKPEDQQGGREPKDKKPDDRDPGKQTDPGQLPPPQEKEKHERTDVSGRWGLLPGKVAEDMMQLSPDQLPEKYFRLIEQYYRRSNEKGKSRK